MNTFVKIEDSDNWVLLVSPNGQFDESLRAGMLQRAIAHEVTEGMTNPFRSEFEVGLRIKTLTEIRIDYPTKAAQNGCDTRVNQIGSNTPIPGISMISETIESEDFPPS